MKTVGLLGGMSWESTATYYRIVNERVKERLGGLHSAKMILASVDFEEIEKLQATGGWEASGDILGDLALKLERAGAEAVALCTNTMHKVADRIKRDLKAPFLHIGDAVSLALKAKGIKRILLLGTRYTMEQDFMKEPMERSGIEVLIPGRDDIETVNRTIYDELCLGIIKDSSREAILAIIGQAESQGAKGAVLGCTELGLLLTEAGIPLLDTAIVHAEAIAEYALS